MDLLRSETSWFRVDGATVSGSVRRAAIRLAEQIGFSGERAAEAGIVASEITSNVWRHADHGSVALRVVLRAGEPGLQLIAIDRGPGIDDPTRAVVDGHSTGGTLGVGMGAISRLSTTFDLWSQPGRGTVQVASMWSRDVDAQAVDIAAITRPLEGETECGDAVAARLADGACLTMVADGLGHGPLAAKASAAAVAAFHESASADPAELLAALHRALAHTRGAAITIARVDASFATLTTAGVGNVSLFVDDGERRRSALSQPGIVGHNAGAARSVDLDLDAHSVVVLHSDGVRDGFGMKALPGLGRRSAAVIAATVLKEAGTRPDDAAVVVIRRAR